jgi:SAM-dependent methyltransferase
MIPNFRVHQNRRAVAGLVLAGIPGDQVPLRPHGEGCSSRWGPNPFREAESLGRPSLSDVEPSLVREPEPAVRTAGCYDRRVDVREISSLKPFARALERFNRKFWWNHNDHYHKWILRRTPTRPGPITVLDVGCGRGDLVDRFRERNLEVTGIDPDPGMARVAASRFAAAETVTIQESAFEQVHEPFDVITMIASLHHQPLADAFAHAHKLLKPNGRLLIVGLAKSQSMTDLAYDVVSSALNPLVALTKKLRGNSERPFDMPMRDPDETFDEIATLARRQLPGVRVRRRLFFRYTLEWAKPSRLDLGS